MAKNLKHTATIDGCVFKRGSVSKRYSHAVINQWDIAQARTERGLEASKNWKRNLAYFQSWVDGTCEFFAKPSYRSEEDHKRMVWESISNAKAWIALGELGHISESIEAFDDSMKNSHVSSDGKSFYGCAGWCSRLDLAQKLAARTHGHIVATEIK